MQPFPPSAPPPNLSVAQNRKGYPRTPVLGLNNGVPYASNVQMTLARGTTHFINVKVTSACTEIVFEWWNGFCPSNNQVEYPNPNPITIRAYHGAISLSGRPILFEGGRDTVVLGPGARIRSQPIKGNFAAGSTFRLANYVEVAELGMYVPMQYLGVPLSGQSNGTPQGYTDYADRSAQMTTYTFPGSFSTTYGFGPIQAWCKQVSRKVCVAHVGDSIDQGNGGTQAASVGGWVSKGLGPNNDNSLGVQKWSMPGSTLSNFMLWRLLAQQHMAGMDIVIVQYATNDIWNLPGGNGTAVNLAAVKATMLSAWKALAAQGSWIVPCTCLPRTTSSDSWATTANQTLDAIFEPIRVAYNGWLRDTSASGAMAQANGDVLTVIDPCKYIEVNSSNVLTLDAGRWKVTGVANAPTNDGIHPQEAYHVLAAQAVTDVLPTLLSAA